MNIHLMLKRAAGAAAVSVMSAAMPQALQAACLNQTNPVTGIQTITCCGETVCCTSTWHGSELLGIVCE
jgi:hypothetical protein